MRVFSDMGRLSYEEGLDELVPDSRCLVLRAVAGDGQHAVLNRSRIELAAEGVEGRVGVDERELPLSRCGKAVQRGLDGIVLAPGYGLGVEDEHRPPLPDEAEALAAGHAALAEVRGEGGERCKGGLEHPAGWEERAQETHLVYREGIIRPYRGYGDGVPALDPGFRHGDIVRTVGGTQDSARRRQRVSYCR